MPADKAENSNRWWERRAKTCKNENNSFQSI